MSDSDEEILLILFALARKKNKRRYWVNQVNEKREERGEYHRLCIELECHEDRFFKYFRMQREEFDELHELIKGNIEKCTTNWRKPIGTRERLAVCLRYLSTGDSFQTIASSFRMGRSTVGNIIREVCREIWKVLQPSYLPSPTTEIWKKAAEGFLTQWGFPNCLGTVDGKHVKLKLRKNSGSQFSLLLLAIVGPDSKFMVVDIGNYGCHSDSALFENSVFYRQYIEGKDILPPTQLPGMNTPVPHVLLGDEGFPLQTFFMRPYPRAGIGNDVRKKRFNAKLSRARRTVDNAFGLLAMRWRVFLRAMEADVECAKYIVKASCCLHNYIISSKSAEEYTTVDAEEESEPVGALAPISATNRRSTFAAMRVREQFEEYFARRKLRDAV